MKLKIFFATLGVCLLAGCGTDKERFVDERPQPPNRPADSLIAPSKKLSEQDLFKVELAVYSYLLQRHFWDENEYSAVFLQGDDDEVAALIKIIPDHVPPIKTSDHADLRPNRTPIDRDTGQPAMILSVDALDPEGDTVQAVGKWYAGGAVSGFYTFALKKNGGDWMIESVK
jgi:hypothetical protein